MSINKQFTRSVFARRIACQFSPQKLGGFLFYEINEGMQMSTGYTKLFSSIVTSTIWVESDRTRIVWITMLAMADKNGEIQASIPGLARLSGVPVPDCEEAITKFLAPDLYSRTPDDEGRRIEKIDGGWALLNHLKYREMASREDSKAATNERVRRFREKEKRNGVKRDVTGCNGMLTQDLHIADADAEADTKIKQAAPAAVVFFPASLDTPDFKTAWQDWQAYRKERRLPAYKPKSIEGQLKALAEWGEPASVAAIRESIRNQWQGLFQPKQAANGAFAYREPKLRIE